MVEKTKSSFAIRHSKLLKQMTFSSAVRKGWGAGRRGSDGFSDAAEGGGGSTVSLQKDFCDPSLPQRFSA